MLVYYSSQTGSLHKSINKANEDAVAYATNKKCSVITLADGVSSCCKSKRGALITTDSTRSYLIEKSSELMALDNKDRADSYVSNIQKTITEASQRENADFFEYSSTSASAFYDKENRKLMYFNLGDSLITVVHKGKLKILSSPSNSMNGCYVTTTNKAGCVTKTNVLDASDIDSVAIFSDGAWSKLLAGNEIRKEIAEMLEKQKYDEVKNFLGAQNCTDDYTFVALDI